MPLIAAVADAGVSVRSSSSEVASASASQALDGAALQAQSAAAAARQATAMQSQPALDQQQQQGLISVPSLQPQSSGESVGHHPVLVHLRSQTGSLTGSLMSSSTGGLPTVASGELKGSAALMPPPPPHPPHPRAARQQHGKGRRAVGATPLHRLKSIHDFLTLFTAVAPVIALSLDSGHSSRVGE